MISRNHHSFSTLFSRLLLCGVQFNSFCETRPFSPFFISYHSTPANTPPAQSSSTHRCLRPGPCEDRIFNLFPQVWAGGTVSTQALLQGPPVCPGDGPGLAAGPLRAAGFTPRAQPPAPSRDRCELPVAPALRGAAGPRGPASLKGRRRGGDGGAEGRVELRGRWS